MNRRRGTLYVIALAAIGCSANGPAPEQSRPPHVLLISLDALRADHLSCAGYHRHTTPFLDRVSAEGTRFSHATVNTHGTPSSHTTMLSSLYQETHRVWAEPRSEHGRAPSIPAEVRLLQEHLGAAGWTTVAVTGGAWMSDAYGFSRGFDQFSDEGREADQATALLLELLEPAVTEGRPVFALFHTYQVHSPYLPPAGYDTLWGDYSSEIRPTWQALRELMQDPGATLDDDDLQFLISQYDGELRFLDDQLRELFARLEAIGFLDNALVLITADHGEEFGDHGGLLHRGTLFEELVRVPMILWGSGVAAGVVDPTLVSTIDIAPTLLAAAGLTVPDEMEGRNILETDPQPWATQRVFAQYRDTLYSVRTPRFKLIRNRNGRLWMFDLVADPRERRDLSATRPALAARLEKELETWRESRPRLGDGVASRTDIDPTTEQRLRSLGYIE